MVARSLRKPPADVEAVDVREHQVEQHDVGKALSGHSQGGLAVLGDDRLVRSHTEDASDELRLLRMVFDDESRFRHAAASRRLALDASVLPFLTQSYTENACSAGKPLIQETCSSTTSPSCSSWSCLQAWPSKTPVPQIRADLSECSKSR